MISAMALLVAVTADPLSGTWEGTSLCQVKPSPCHDEHVIYRVTVTAPQRYRFNAYKLVGGKELFMGTIDLTFVAARKELSGTISGQRGAAAVRFSIEANHLSGSMRLNGQLYRLIEVDKR